MVSIKKREEENKRRFATGLADARFYQAVLQHLQSLHEKQAASYRNPTENKKLFADSDTQAISAQSEKSTNRLAPAWAFAQALQAVAKNTLNLALRNVNVAVKQGEMTEQTASVIRPILERVYQPERVAQIAHQYARVHDESAASILSEEVLGRLPSELREPIENMNASTSALPLPERATRQGCSQVVDLITHYLLAAELPGVSAQRETYETTIPILKSANSTLVEALFGWPIFSIKDDLSSLSSGFFGGRQWDNSCDFFDAVDAGLVPSPSATLSSSY